MQPDLYMNPDKSFTSEYPCRGLLDNHRHPGDVIRIQEIDRITYRSLTGTGLNLFSH